MNKCSNCEIQIEITEIDSNNYCSQDCEIEYITFRDREVSKWALLK